MEKEFVTYEQAVKLKELGFDESCFGFYENGVFIFWYDSKQETELPLNCSAPLKQQVFRWFREEFNLLNEISFYREDGRTKKSYWFTIFKWDDKMLNREIIRSKNYTYYLTYEESENACINKLISLIESKI